MDAHPTRPISPPVPEEKKQSYDLFLAVMRAALIHIAFALTALVSFAFAHTWSVAMGFLTLAIGTLVVLIDLARRSHFGLSLAVLVIAMLVTAINIA